MGRDTTPTFIQNFEIKPLGIGKKLGAYRDLEIIGGHYRKSYNATLGHFYNIAKAMKSSKSWSDARKIRKKSDKRKAFEGLKKEFGYTQSAFETYVKNIRSNETFYRHTHSAVMQASVSNRAMAAIDKYIYAKAKRVRFKRFGDFFSFEGKQNSTGVRLFHKKDKAPFVCTVQGLNFGIVFDQTDSYHIHGFTSRVKYARVLKKFIRGKTRYFIQGVFEGLPFDNVMRKAKYQELVGKKSEDNVVGLDFGPSHVYMVDSDGEAKTFRLSDDVERKTSQIKTLQRKLDRQRRASNPDNYNKDGTIKKGPKKWVKTKSYLRNQRKKADIEGKKTASRKSSHGRLSNEILAHSNKIKTENVSYKSWQKMFGKSIGQHAPSALEGELTRKAENARGWCKKISTRQTALSQKCLCGVKKKKPLSQREHRCGECGFNAPRDYLSAYLAIYCKENINELRKSKEWKLDLDQARSKLCGEWYFFTDDAKLADNSLNFNGRDSVETQDGSASSEKLVGNLLISNESFLRKEKLET